MRIGVDVRICTRAGKGEGSRLNYQKPAMSTEILPTKVVAALDGLTTEKGKELFFHLKVPLKTLDDIDTNSTGNMRKIRYVQAWFDQEVKASWEKIVAGLKLMGLNSLAETIASQHCSRETSTSAAIDMSPDLPSPPATAPEASGPQTSGSSPNDPSLGPVVRPSSPSSPSDRVSQVRAEIDRLSDTFSDLMSDTRDELCTRESVDPSFLKKFRDRLLDLPVAKKAPHARFFQRNEDDLLVARNMDKIFAILRRYCSYCNYEILQEVVRKFCQSLLQRRMQEYCKCLEIFEKATAINVYLEAISAGIVLSSEFAKMVMIIKKPASVCTLYNIRKLKETIAERASLHSYSVYIGDITESSVRVVLGFPASCVEMIQSAMTPPFLATHLLSDVVIGEQPLSILDRPQLELVSVIVFEKEEAWYSLYLYNYGHAPNTTLHTYLALYNVSLFPVHLV